MENLFGRRTIYTSAKEINAENVIHEVVEKAYITHLANRSEIDYLYNYFKGKQPILYRVKEIRPEVNNRIVENRSAEIVNFHTAYLVGEAIQYVSNGGDDAIGKNVAELNKMMNVVSKASLDHDLVEWQNICGTAYRMALPSAEEVDCPFEIYTLDPRNTFVIYSNDVSHKPLAGVYYTMDENNNISAFSVYTENNYYEFTGGKREGFIEIPHSLGMIPIIEYPANNDKTGAFEKVLSILDAIDKLDSDSLNGVEQFVQSLMVIFNADFDDEETSNTIREKGMLILNNIGEGGADVKIISEQLDQTQVHILKQDLYQAVLNICGMPSINGNTSESSNNGAIIMKNGWQQAESRAKDCELMFKKSEKKFLKLILRIVNDLVPGFELSIADIDYRFTRRCYENIQVKSQVLTTMLSNEKIDPQLAFNACGLFTDPENAYLNSMAWYESHKPTEVVVATESTEEEDDELATNR